MAFPMSNRLAQSSSPYLRQHADNPVDWHPWNAATLQLARETGKPILLSIGYSACHWCHVMAHESFEDDATAAVMNEHFINIKVDREERPDLDKIYQLAQQILTQHAGGWPLTMFLSHDTQQPFFGGTYFPPTPRHGLPGFKDLLTRVAAYYREHRDSIEVQHEALQNVFNDLQPVPERDEPLNELPLQRARAALAQQFDGEFGGFGGAPKFPHTRTLEFLLQRWHATSGDETPDLQALYMAALTLTRMSEGGLFDHVGGGFFRYSVDQYWMIPHFEKMLYDNAELLRVYSQAALATGERAFKHAAQRTAAWLLREMRAPSKAFLSTLDADSEGHEGRYYVWDAAHVARLLSEREYAICAKRYGFNEAANFEGKWHFHAYRSIDDVAKELQLSADEVEHELEHAMHKLFAARNERMRPHLDDKVLTSWNALTISALAQAARALDDNALTQAACDAMDQLRSKAWINDRLFAVQSQDQTLYPAYLDDYAYLLDACLELLQTRWRDQDLRFAMQLAETLLKHFADTERGGFYFTADDHEPLIHRSKSFSDDATPAGNAIAAFNLQRLGYLLGESRYLRAAEHTLRAEWAALMHHPSAHAALLIALEEFLNAPQLIILRGRNDEPRQWQRSLNRVYQPHRLVLAIPADAALPDPIGSKVAKPETVAYLCQGMTCSEPVSSLEALIALAR
jgi:uncharacterized protein